MRIVAMCVATLIIAFGDPASAQESKYLGRLLPDGQQPQAGVMPQLEIDNIHVDGLSAKTATNVLHRLERVESFVVRGKRDQEIFAKWSPSVVLVVTNEGLGSGSLLGSGLILTSLHVVHGYGRVGVIYKPQLVGREPTEADIVLADVVRVEEGSDLALLNPVSRPQNIEPFELGKMNELQVGEDVHAIGHPTGETWTYTKGLISQIRNGYKWKGENNTKHYADVIQTQTPINPGNSGGPLLNDAGQLIGVNTFKMSGEALNFAVAISTVRSFLAAPSNTGRQSSLPRKDKESDCQTRVLYEGRTADKDGFVRRIDSNCDGVADLALYIPDDIKQAIEFLGDTNNDGTIDTIISDNNRDGKWDISYYDVDNDGKFDLIGYHPDGNAQASRYAEYKG